MHTNSLGRLVAILHRNNQMYLNSHLKPWDITSGEVGILMRLYSKEGKTQEELSQWMHIDKAAITRTIHTLEEKGIIIRKQDSKDRRCNRIYLTEKGKQLEAEIVPIVRSWSEHISKIIGQEAYTMLCEELESLLSVLKKESV
ncbi:MAG: MarR family winged helix-turn-helix transcriptional regulator [Sphaerochaetaceae bacterium]